MIECKRTIILSNYYRLVVSKEKGKKLLLRKCEHEQQNVTKSYVIGNCYDEILLLWSE